MESPTPVSTGSPLVARTKAILLQPKAEWGVIAAEPGSIGGIYTRYVMILAAIPVICGLIGSLLVGYTLFGVTYRPSTTGALVSAVVQYALSLGGVFVLALIIDALAPNFGGTPNRVQAFKVAAYSMTAAWVAGVFQIVPSLAILALLGALYGLYLLYLGLPRLMNAPDDKAAGYTAVVVVAAIVIGIVIGAITAPIASRFASAGTVADGTLSGELAVPGVGSVDLARLEEASKKMEAAAKNMENAAANGDAAGAVPATQLQALLPGALGALPRTEVSSASGGAAGIGGSHAQARYEAGESRVTLELTDMAAAGALAALGSAFNVQSSKQTATGYEKTETIDGRLTTEEWDSQSKSGKYSVVVASRFLVEARGDNVDVNLLKGAVAAVGIERLEGLAK